MTAPVPSDIDGPAGEADEAYEIGKRDGYEEAVQAIDVRTGGDGEYRFCTDHDPKRHTPDPAAMIERIVERFEVAKCVSPPAGEAGDLIEPVAWQRFVNVVDPPKWVDIDKAEKGEWERLGYPIRALVPASALAAYQAKVDEAQSRYDSTFDQCVALVAKLKAFTERAEAADAKVAALTADVDWFKGERDGMRDILFQERASAAALRTALEQIAEGDWSWINRRKIVGAWGELARAALPAKGEG